MTRFFASLVTGLSVFAFASPVCANDLSWECFGSLNGKSVRYVINDSQGPGADVVIFRDASNHKVFFLTATGPITEEVIPVGRGQDGIREKRVYRDSLNRRWIYGNWDAHPSFTLHEAEGTQLLCTPVFGKPGGGVMKER